MSKKTKPIARAKSTGRPVAKSSAEPILNQRGAELQAYGTVVNIPTGLDADARTANVESLNLLLANVITLRDMYKKHHWQVSGHTFYQLHLLFDKHADELTKLIDEIGERIQILGGIALAMAADVAETTTIERPPRGREPVPVQIDRLLEAHGVVLDNARDLADQSDENEDHATNDLMASKTIPLNETQVWFVSEHVVEGPLVRTDDAADDND